MPKLKTKSSVKKGRFKITGSGKIMVTQSGKRHGMTKRPQRQIRNNRGMTVMHEADVQFAKYFVPYSV